MASTYPNTLDSLSTSHVNNAGETINAVTINDLADAVNKIEAELGTTPSSSYATLSARLSGREFNVLDYGAVGNGTNDDTSAVQAAIDAAEVAGGLVFFPGPAIYRITSTLTVQADAVSLAGDSYVPRVNGGAFGTVGARLRWSGADSGGPIVKIAPSASGTQQLGNRVESLVIDGNQLAGTGLQIQSSSHGIVRDVHIHECKTASLDMGIVGGSDACRGWTIEQLSIFNFGGNGTGILLSNNVFDCVFVHPFVRVADATTAVDILDADDCFFYGMFIGSPGTAHAIELRGGDGANLAGARNCHFFALYPNNGGIFSRNGSGGGLAARNNTIWALSYEDGTEPEVTIESSSTLGYFDTRSGGRWRSTWSVFSNNSSVTPNITVENDQNNTTANILAKSKTSGAAQITAQLQALNNGTIQVGSLTSHQCHLTYGGTGQIVLTASGPALPTGKALYDNATTGAFIRFGTNTPEGAVSAPVGSLFLRTNGGAATTLYIKESGTGNTGWVAK